MFNNKFPCLGFLTNLMQEKISNEFTNILKTLRVAQLQNKDYIDLTNISNSELWLLSIMAASKMVNSAAPLPPYFEIVRVVFNPNFSLDFKGVIVYPFPEETRFIADFNWSNYANLTHLGVLIIRGKSEYPTVTHETALKEKISGYAHLFFVYETPKPFWRAYFIHLARRFAYVPFGVFVYCVIRQYF